MSGPLFLSETKRRISRDVARNSLRRRQKDLGFSDEEIFSPHQLRHEFATRLTEMGVEMFEPKVIYYAPTKSEFLINLNEIATNKLFEGGIKPDEYYLPEQWVPHIALGVQLTSIELTQALEIEKEILSLLMP